MNQGYNARYAEMRENDPTQSDPQGISADTGDDCYTLPGTIRNICFAWPDGRRMFLNYTFLVSGDYLPLNDRIELLFTTHSVNLKGFYLDVLFEDLMAHIPRKIFCTEARYNAIGQPGTAVINNIQVSPLK